LRRCVVAVALKCEASPAAAKTLDVSLPTDELLWTFARAWLRESVQGDGWGDRLS